LRLARTTRLCRGESVFAILFRFKPEPPFKVVEPIFMRDDSASIRGASFPDQDYVLAWQWSVSLKHRAPDQSLSRRGPSTVNPARLFGGEATAPQFVKAPPIKDERHSASSVRSPKGGLRLSAAEA
jgi:hypothetical protein